MCLSGYGNYVEKVRALGRLKTYVALFQSFYSQIAEHVKILALSSRDTPLW